MTEAIVARSLTGRDWIEPPVDAGLARALAQRHDLPEVVGRLLAMRGVDLDAAPGFLEPRLRDQMPDPSLLLDMDKAAERLARAVRTSETVGIISDYDVDGCTSAALVLRWAGHLGLRAKLRIPQRLQDGYGPSPRLFDALAADGCGLVLVLDSGINAFDALAHARARGLEVIVVDHHGAEAELPPALAVVNPNRLDQEGPWGSLAAVGVTFLLLVATNRALRAEGHFERVAEPPLLHLLDLVALGTVADVVPLLGLNRALVRQGLKVMAEARTVGVDALARAAGLKAAPTAQSIAFALAPRINAAGRLDDPEIAARLLVTDDGAEAAALAERLDALNAERRAVEQRVLDQAERLLEPQVRADRRVLFAASEDWHPGVLGIVAGRLAERQHRPVLVAAIGDGEAVGSARAPEGFDLGAALRRALAQGLARKAGGHARAGGFTVPTAALEPFHALLEAGAGVPTRPRLRVDAPIAVGGARIELVRALERLEPYGEQHPRPRVRIVGARLAGSRVVGERHLRLRIHGHDGGALDAVAFRAVGTPLEDAARSATSLPSVQVAGRLSADHFRGVERVELHLDDIAPDR